MKFYVILFLAKKKLNFRDMVDETDIKTDINFADLQNFLMSRWILLQNYLLTTILEIIIYSQQDHCASERGVSDLA